MQRIVVALAALLFTSVAVVAQEAPFLWIEAENADRTDFPPAAQNPFGPANPEEAEKLSGGEWIGTQGEHGPLFLEYDINVPEAGEYTLYVRKFWQHGPFRWRITPEGEDGGEWREVGSNLALLDSVELRTHTGANWVNLGPIELEAGEHTLRAELIETEGAAAFDAWLLTKGDFTARGTLKPGEKYSSQIDVPEGWFAFEPDADPFGEPAIDLRKLNEDEAGSKGFIKTQDGGFVHADTGEPIRFWGVNTGHGLLSDRAAVDEQAKFLAKRGVNLVRLHGGIYPRSGETLDPRPEAIEELQYAVAAFKREGIYTCLSIYFPLWVSLDESDGWEGYNNQHPFALLYFDPKFQEIYRGWWRALMLEENPHTGMPLAEDPAVAMAEIINEDSFFFWTFTPGNNVPSEQMPKLNKLFGDWLAKKHGSIRAALQAHGNVGDVEGDNPAQGEVGVPAVSRLVFNQDERSKDAAEFLTELQRGFYDEMTTFLRDEIGFKGSIYASNWTTASAQYLDPLERYTYTASDFLDRHGYYDIETEGEGAAYSVRTGHTYADRTATKFQHANPQERNSGHSFSMPLMHTTYKDTDGEVRASMLSEFDWPQPNRFRAELPLLTAAYSSLQGLDAPVFFSAGVPGWLQVINKWPLQAPDMIGQFPTAAYVFRNGLVEEAEPVVQVIAGVEHLKRLGGAPPAAPVNLDLLRAADVPEGRTAPVEGVESIDPRAFVVGQVQFDFRRGRTPATLRASNLTRYIDEQAKTIQSATGELHWNYDTGLVTANAPQFRGVTGFLADAGAIELGDVHIESPLEYGAIMLVALDGKPVEESGLLLLQAMSEVKNFGYETSEINGGRKRIDELGGPPLLVRELAGTVTLPGSLSDATVTPLDANLYPAGEAKPAGGSVELQPDVLYYLIER